MRRLKKVHAGSPLHTNASRNRQSAVDCFKAGMTPAQIAEAFPEVWRLDADGRLSQRYDYELADGSGRYETRYLITRTAVRDAIAKHTSTNVQG